MHFEGGTVAQIVYSGDQGDRGQQQVVYTADGNSYTSVESTEHTLVYIHPADGSQVRGRVYKYMCMGYFIVYFRVSSKRSLMILPNFIFARLYLLISPKWLTFNRMVQPSR